MKRVIDIVGLLIFICSLSLLLVSGQATGQTIKSDASMNDILAEETAKSKAEIAAMREAAAERKAAAGKIKSDATMNDILAEETAKSKKEFVAMKKAAAVKKAAEEKTAKEKTAK